MRFATGRLGPPLKHGSVQKQTLFITVRQRLISRSAIEVEVWTNGMPQQIDRFLTALPRGNRHVYLSWRLSGPDADDEPFYVQRRRPQGDWRQLHDSTPVVSSTDFVDTVPDDGVHEYRVVARQRPSCAARVDTMQPATNLAFEFPLTHAPPPGLYPYRFAIGDIYG